MTAVTAQDASGARNFSELILTALAREGGLTKDEICNRIDAYGVRVERALQHQLNMGILERDMDYALQPPAWRHWMRGQKPPGWRSKRPSIEKAPATTPPPEPHDSTSEPDDEDLDGHDAKIDVPTPAPASAAAPVRSNRVLDWINQHPGGSRVEQIRAGTGLASAGTMVIELFKSGRVARKGVVGDWTYFPMGPTDTEATATNAASRRSGVEDEVLKLVQQEPGISGQKIGTTLGRKKTAGVAQALAKKGVITFRDRRYYPPAHPTTPGDAPKPTPRKPAAKTTKRAPRALEVRGVLDVDAIEKAAQRVRTARAALDAAEAELRALIREA